MGNLTIAAVFIVVLNVLMWFVQLSIYSINPAGTTCFSLSGSIIENSATVSGDIMTLNSSVENQLPSAQTTTVSPSSTAVSFTDVYNSIIGFFKSSATGLKYLYGIVAAPSNILKCLNLPNQISVGLGVLWYIISLLILIIFIMRGGD